MFIEKEKLTKDMDSFFKEKQKTEDEVNEMFKDKEYPTPYKSKSIISLR